VALGLYAVGAWFAWLVFGLWWFPEGHPRAYEPSKVPLILPLLGGLLGVAFAVLWQHRTLIPPRKSAASVAGRVSG
jgi:hypothetical protein